MTYVIESGFEIVEDSRAFGVRVVAWERTLERACRVAHDLTITNSGWIYKIRPGYNK